MFAYLMGQCCMTSISTSVSIHVCTVCIWCREHTRLCVEVFYASCVNFHSFRSKADDEFCFVVRLAVSKHRGQPNLQRAFGSSQSLPQSAGPRVRDERSPCLSAMATSMPSFPKDTPKMRRLRRWKKHNLCLQSCVIHDGSKFPAWTFFFPWSLC